MKFDSSQENQLTVFLTREDLLALDITIERMDYATIETRRVIWTLLDRARQETNTRMDLSGRLLIEVIPDNQDGCALCFTALAPEPGRLPRHLLRKVTNRPLVLEFAKVDDLLCAVDAFRGLESLPESSELYHSGTSYRLIIPACHNSALPVIASQFATVHKETLSAAFTREHWHPVTIHRALEKLAQAFST